MEGKIIERITIDERAATGLYPGILICAPAPMDYESSFLVVSEIG